MEILTNVLIGIAVLIIMITIVLLYYSKGLIAGYKVGYKKGYAEGGDKVMSLIKRAHRASVKSSTKKNGKTKKNNK